ncbi:MAG: hypothetical protein ACT4OF_00975 [Caulobacteraceae bacterium]
MDEIRSALAIKRGANFKSAALAGRLLFLHIAPVEKHPDRMKPGERRALTSGEIALGRSVFDDEIAWSKVRILQAPALGFGAMVPIGRTIVFSKWRAAYDFAGAPMWDQGWFIHELAHVWQAARGVVLAGAKLGALGKGAYLYRPRQPKLSAYNIERQAEIARHLFLARAGAPEEGAPSREWLEETWASR